MIIVDRTRQQTLENVESWYDEIKKRVPEKIPILLVGNKNDLQETNIIEEELGQIADKYGFSYILTSAKSGENIFEAFLYIALKYLESIV